MKIEFVLHKFGDRDQFAELTWPVCPREGEKIIFNSVEWTVREVTHDFERQLARVIVAR